jgi:hypothetical protein
MAVFTSEAAAEWAAAQLPGRALAIAGMRGEAVFRLAGNAKTWVRVSDFGQSWGRSNISSAPRPFGRWCKRRRAVSDGSGALVQLDGARRANSFKGLEPYPFRGGMLCGKWKTLWGSTSYFTRMSLSRLPP